MPILRMVAGCMGEREDSKGSTPWLSRSTRLSLCSSRRSSFALFGTSWRSEDIDWAFLITDSEENFGQMRRTLGTKYECVQLYKSYLENFRINTQDALNG